jgi:hypothetical protein
MSNTVDLLAWPSTTEPAFNYCTGAQLLVQRFVLELLTELGTIKYRPTRGSSFLGDLRSGRVHNESDLYAAFALAEAVIRNTLQGEETSSMNDAERYKKASISNLVLGEGSVHLRVQIQSLASTTTITIPVYI